MSFFYRSGFLEFEVGSVITILDKNSDVWSGVRDETGHVGLFMPTQTVTYLGTIPKTSISNQNPNNESSGNFGNIFNPSNSRNKKRLSREGVTTPQNFQHKSHGSMDGSSGNGNVTEGKVFNYYVTKI